jgi:hypothetical protein
MMEQNEPGVTRMISEDPLQRPELRRRHDADGVSERDVAAGIRLRRMTP